MSPATRMKQRDYADPGLYFVTICSDFKRCVLGKVEEKKTVPSALGNIVHESWMKIPSHFAHTRLHGFVVMPNRLHGIVEIACVPRAQHAAPVQGRGPVPAGSLSIIVRSLKAEVTRRAKLELSWRGEIWQRNYFDRVIRDGEELSDAERYIAENPVRWHGQVKNWLENDLIRQDGRSMLRHYKGGG